MPRTNSSEVSIKAGSDIYARRLNVTGAQWFNLGILNSPPGQSNQPNNLKSFDERGGARVLDEESIIEFEQSLSIDTRDHQAEIMSLFFGANTPGVFTQAATPVVGEAHTAIKLGGYIALGAPVGAATPARVYNVSAVVVKDVAGTTTFAAGTDYILDAVKGIIRFPTNSAIPDASEVRVDYTPAVMSTAMVDPQTLIAGVEVQLEVWEVSDSGTSQRNWQIPRARITSGGSRTMGASVDNFVQLTATILADASLAQPAGRYVVVA